MINSERGARPLDMLLKQFSTIVYYARGYQNSYCAIVSLSYSAAHHNTCM